MQPEVGQDPYTAPCSFGGELICYDTHLGRQSSTQVVLHQRILRAQLHIAGLGGARLLRLLGDSGGLVWDRRSFLTSVLQLTPTDERVHTTLLAAE